MHTTYRLLALVAITVLLSTLLPLSTNAQNMPRGKSLITTTQSTQFNSDRHPTGDRAFREVERFRLSRMASFNALLNNPSPTNDNGFARATWLAQLHIVQDQTTCERLQQQAAPVIRLFGREHTVQFFIYLDNYPNMQTIAGSYLGVSTGLIQLLKRDTPDNAQLNGLVAHELARDIQKEGFITAWKNEDLQTLRAYELFYDAVATASMNHLRMPSQQYALILERMIAHAGGHNTVAHATQL